MANMNKPASNTASFATQQIQAETSTASSMPDITQLSLDYDQDIFKIVCCNDSFQLALDHSTIKTLLRVCKRARPFLSSKVPRFNTWCQNAGLCNPEGQLRIGLTPNDQISLSLHFDDQITADRSWLEDQADQGNASASYLLAYTLQVIIGYLKRSQQKGLKQQIILNLMSAAKADHAMAQFYLAGCYRVGYGVDQDHAKAIELYRSLAERGMPQAQVALGQYFENGEGVNQSFTTAIEWYSKSANQGNDDARDRMAFLRGWFSFIGHGVEQSDVVAFNHWQEVSTKSTDPVLKPIATHMLGWMHYLGRGTERNEQKGVRIIRENRSDEFPFGEDDCLASYWNNIKSNQRTARKFFDLCQLGSDRDWLCRHLMAVCLMRGFGTIRDQEKSAAIFEQLAEEGHSDSQFWIGMCYYWGAGVSQDHKKAFEWYSKSANQGSSFGQWMVGHCYYFGTGATQDQSKALEWYRKSTEQGNRYGQYYCGHCFQNGWGVPKDIDTAILWFRKSADQGYKFAIDRLKELDQWP